MARSSDGIVSSQRKCTLDILEDNRQLGRHSSSFPKEQNLEIGQCDESDKTAQHSRLKGRLSYLQGTRPNTA